MSLPWGKDYAYAWPKGGDEWDDQATFCGVPYEAWKQALIDDFVSQHRNPKGAALDLAAGHGRWTIELLKSFGVVYAVDHHAGNVRFCQKAFPDARVKAILNDGRTLAEICDKAVDFVWCYDSMVHMPVEVVQSYVAEICRVLGDAGRAVLHHAGRPRKKDGEPLDGGRQPMTKEMFAAIARQEGLVVVRQTNTWGANERCSCKKFGDMISVLRKG